MARLIPPYCSDSTSPGELAVFQNLASTTDADDWIVFHSLFLAEHVRQIEGEADFVILIPSMGLLVVEVKAHRSLQVLDDGRWRLGRRAPTSRSPFTQAREAMYSARQYLADAGVDTRRVPMAYACWFTHVRARSLLPPSPEWHNWQVLDSEDLRRGAAGSIRRTMASALSHLSSKAPRIAASSREFDSAVTASVARALRPRFEVHVAPGDLRRDREDKLVRYVEEQFDALDAMSENRAVLFAGPAGSGKTMLATEAARRESATGRKGALLCFNRLLGRYLTRQMAMCAGLEVSTFHSALLKIAGIDPPPKPETDFWERELPERALDVLLVGGSSPFEFVVVDEVQDLAHNMYLDLLDLMVVGGLKHGRVLLFGDFDGQSLYQDSHGAGQVTDRAAGFAKHRLVVNCRNLPRIGHSVNALTQLEPGFKRFRRDDDGVDPEFKKYQRGQDQATLLLAAIRELRDQGFELDEITVLSPLAEGSVASSASNEWLGRILKSADGLGPSKGHIRHSSIHAFKGLESPAVVLTDLDDQVTTHFEALLYVGLTRATDRLVVFVESDTFGSIMGAGR